MSYEVFPTHPHRAYGTQVLLMYDDNGDLYDSVRTEPFYVGDIVRPIFHTNIPFRNDHILRSQGDMQNLGHLRYKSGNPIPFFPFQMGDMQPGQEFTRVYAVPGHGVDSRRAYRGVNEMILPNKFSQ